MLEETTTVEETKVDESVSTTESTDESTKAAEEKAAKEEESRKSREYHEATSQQVLQEMLAALKDEDPDAYNRVMARTKKEGATKTDEKKDILDEEILTADIPVKKLLGMIEEAAARGVSSARTTERYSEAIATVKHTLTQAVSTFKSTREEQDAAVAEADDIMPIEECNTAEKLKRRARLIVKELNRLKENRTTSARIETTKAEEEARVAKVNAQAFPAKTGAPGKTIVESEPQKHLKRLEEVGPKSSRSLLDSQRK